MSRKKGIAQGLDLTRIQGLNPRQERVLTSDKNQVLSGFAGTGKTFLASFQGFKKVIIDREYDKVLYIRSVVPTRNMGFLPGDEKEKAEVYESPYVGIASELFNRGDAYNILKAKDLVNFASTSFIRGNNIKNSFVIVDECQNMTYHELDTIITRLHDNCRIVFCGDIRQADLYKNGLGDFFKVLKSMGEFDFTEFAKEDIVRSELVRNYIVKKEEILGIL